MLIFNKELKREIMKKLRVRKEENESTLKNENLKEKDLEEKDLK